MATVMEERFAALEAEVARLRNRVEEQYSDVPRRTSPDFLNSMIGIHANSSAFEEVTRQIEQEREREREEARRLLAADKDS
jgi:7,8-dihydro-6-hydroxymethylpterin-pyrophosphokinase